MPAWVKGVLSLLVAIALCGVCNGGTLPGAPNCPLFPANNVWNADISALPVDPNSANYISNMSPGTGLHPDFGSFAGYGIPYNVVSSAQPKVNVDFSTYGYPSESDNGPYPFPATPNIEGNDQNACNALTGGDCHVLIVDKDACILYETWETSYTGGQWHAGSGAMWSLNSNALRTDGWTSGDAAGLPILPGLVRYDEVIAGTINHAFRFTMVHTQKAHVYPARHDASSNTNPNVPPMGLRVRLKMSANLSGLSPQALVIAHAMQKYGLILADNGSNWYISGASDPNFNDSDLHTLNTLHGSDFEVVDTSTLRNGPDNTTATVNVGQGGNKFVDTASSTTTTTIPVNTTVSWNWVSGYHSTTSGTCSGSCTADGLWDSQQNNPSNTFMRVFNQLGTYPYFCSVHGVMMQGTVIVGTPDYGLAIANSAQTVFAGQTASFNGTLTAVSGYNSAVNLSCGPGHPATCNPSPPSQTPTALGAPFAVSAGDTTPQDYTFNVQGAGTDLQQTSHAQSITVRVVDFSLGAPSPSSITVTDGNTSAPATLPVIPLGSFGYPVTLNCSGLPANTNCAFNNQPAPAIVSTGPVDMTITSSGAAPGTYGSLSITAASNPPRPGGSLSQPFSLTINPASGSTNLSVSDGAPEAVPLAHQVGRPVTFTFAVQNSGGTAPNTQTSVMLSNASPIQSATFTHGGPATPCGLANNIATCNLGTMANPDSASVVVTVLPKFARNLTATAVVNSSARNGSLPGSHVPVVRQLRPQPFARRGLRPRIP